MISGKLDTGGYWIFYQSGYRILKMSDIRQNGISCPSRIKSKSNHYKNNLNMNLIIFSPWGLIIWKKTIWNQISNTFIKKEWRYMKKRFRDLGHDIMETLYKRPACTFITVTEWSLSSRGRSFVQTIQTISSYVSDR